VPCTVTVTFDNVASVIGVSTDSVSPIENNTEPPDVENANVPLVLITKIPMDTAFRYSEYVAAEVGLPPQCPVDPAKFDAKVVARAKHTSCNTVALGGARG